jgi:hypothetical protein
VRDLAHVDTAVDEFRAGRLDVVDDEQEALQGIGRLGSDQRFRRSEVEPLRWSRGGAAVWLRVMVDVVASVVG